MYIFPMYRYCFLAENDLLNRKKVLLEKRKEFEVRQKEVEEEMKTSKDKLIKAVDLRFNDLLLQTQTKLETANKRIRDDLQEVEDKLRHVNHFTRDDFIPSIDPVEDNNSLQVIKHVESTIRSYLKKQNNFSYHEYSSTKVTKEVDMLCGTLIEEESSFEPKINNEEDLQPPPKRIRKENNNCKLYFHNTVKPLFYGNRSGLMSVNEGWLVLRGFRSHSWS